MLAAVLFLILVAAVFAFSTIDSKAAILFAFLYMLLTLKMFFINVSIL